MINIQLELSTIISLDLLMLGQFELILARTTRWKSLLSGKQNKEKSARTLVVIQLLSWPVVCLW